MRARQTGRRWTWTAVRPHSVCGYAAGNPMNLAVVLALYGAMLKELGRPFAFPGNEACYSALFQVIDAQLLAGGSIARCCTERYVHWITRWPGGPAGNSKSSSTIYSKRGAGLCEFHGVSPNCSLTGNWCHGVVP